MAKKKIEDEVQDTAEAADSDGGAASGPAVEAPAVEPQAMTDIEAPAPAIPVVAPTVGRIVHFGTPSLASLIVAVGDEGKVNLAVFATDGSVSGTHDTPYAEGAKPGCWTWPPR